jgi:M6 family metalloprotease-like protein
MSTPFFNKQFTFTQPDGTKLQVKGWGNQHYARFETLDGYTVIKDPVTGFYHYANTSDNQNTLRPTGIIPGSRSLAGLNLSRSIRVDKESTKFGASESSRLLKGKSRWEQRRNKKKEQPHFRGIASAPPKQPTSGEYRGFCMLVKFPDVSSSISQDEVSAFCNQHGYKGFGNHGSVYDYFYENSLKKVKYTNIVTPYYTTKKKRAYYADPSLEQPIRTCELIQEALSYFVNQGFDFSNVSVDHENFIYALNVFYAGAINNNWGEGLWPHSYHLNNPFVLPGGKKFNDYQITNMGDELSLGTFCHENGHMLCDFPDLYDYGYESSGIGAYCLMCGGADPDEKNPINFCGYLKYAAGWDSSTTELTSMQNIKIIAGKNQFFAYHKSNTEYFLIENRQKTGRDKELPDSGLAIWHIDEKGSNNNEQMNRSKHYECSLEQADGNYDLEHRQNQGDKMDLFCLNNKKIEFSPSTSPSSNWWDGSQSKLRLHNISKSKKEMTFDVKIG